MSEAVEPEKEFGLSARWRVIGGIGGVIAVIEDSRRGTAGFRFGAARAAE